jgi:hypothetical protein
VPDPSIDDMIDSDELVPVGEPLPVAEAGFLKDGLAKSGIRARVQDAEPGPDGDRLAVVVPRHELSAAQALRARLLGEETGEKPRGTLRERAGSLAWKMAIAGLFGALMGARVGAKMRGTPLAAVTFSVALAGIAALAVWTFWPSDARGKPPS